MKNLPIRNTLELFALLALVACKQEAAPNPEKEAPVVAEKTEVAPPTPIPQPAEPEAPAPTVDPKADFIRVRVSHNPPKDGDPVEVGLGTFSITSAMLADPENLVGAKAELEIDLGSLTSGIEKRDAHLKSPDYLDVGVHPKATIKISDVKKASGEDRYTAKVAVSAHGLKKVFTVAFAAAEATDEGVRAAGEHTFKRSDFGIGKAVGDGTGEEVTLQFQLFFKKS